MCKYFTRIWHEHNKILVKFFLDIILSIRLCIILRYKNKFLACSCKILKENWYCSCLILIVRQERESVVDSRVMNIITNDNSFKNHAKFMPDIVNILHKHAKSLQDSCKYQSRILPNLVRNFTRFICYISCQFLPNYLVRNLARFIHILSILALTTLHDLAKSCKETWRDSLCYISCQFLPLPCMILPNLVRNVARFIYYISCQFYLT